MLSISRAGLGSLGGGDVAFDFDLAFAFGFASPIAFAFDVAAPFVDFLLHPFACLLPVLLLCFFFPPPAFNAAGLVLPVTRFLIWKSWSCSPAAFNAAILSFSFNAAFFFSVLDESCCLVSDIIDWNNCACCNKSCRTEQRFCVF